MARSGSKLTPIGDVPFDMLEDKDNGHTWRTDRKLTMRAPSWGVRRSKQCAVCRSWKHELLNSRGQVDPYSRKYELSDRYKLVSGYTRADARAEIIRRERHEEHAQRMARADKIVKRRPRRLRAVG